MRGVWDWRRWRWVNFSGEMEMGMARWRWGHGGGAEMEIRGWVYGRLGRVEVLEKKMVYKM